MRTRPSALAMVGLLGALPGWAAAKEGACMDRPCLAGAQRPGAGSHFLVEVNGGSAVVGGRGPALGALVGVGGKLRGWPWRFYLVGEVAYSASTDEGTSPTLGVAFRDERTRHDLDFGLRVYLPVWGPVRLFGDLLGGASHVTATIERSGWPTLSEDYWQGTVVAATGLQIRLIPRLAVGARARFALTGEDADGLRVTLGSPSSRPVTCMAGLTWHF